MAGNEKLVFMVLHGPKEPEHATIPFVMACAALGSDVDVVIGLQADGVQLGRIGGVDNVEAAGFPPLKRLIADFQALGGRLLVCGVCLDSRGIVAPDQLIAGADVVGAYRFIAEITSATNSLVY